MRRSLSIRYRKLILCQRYNCRTRTLKNEIGALSTLRHDEPLSAVMGAFYPAAPIAVSAAVFGLLARHALEMRTKKNYREMWGSLTLSLMPAALFCLWVGCTEYLDMLARNLFLVPAGALLGASAFAWAGYVYHDMTAQAQTAPSASNTFMQTAQLLPSERGPFIDQSVRSDNQSGGITAHTVIIGPTKRNLDTAWGDPLKAQILSNLPRDKELIVMAVLGDAEAGDLALQIHAFLKANGFKLKEDGISQGVFSPTPHGLNFNPDNNTFIVGAQ